MYQNIDTILHHFFSTLFESHIHYFHIALLILQYRHLRSETHSSTPNLTINMETTNFLSLPRELRDLVYSHLVVTTYRVDTSPTYLRTVPLSFDGSCEKSRTADQKETSDPLFAFEQPSDRLAILLVNKMVGKEALEMLYKESVFLFNVEVPKEKPEGHWPAGPHWGNNFCQVKAVDLMKHIVIRFDQREAHRVWLSPRCGLFPLLIYCAWYLICQLNPPVVQRESFVLQLFHDSQIGHYLRTMDSPKYMTRLSFLEKLAVGIGRLSSHLGLQVDWSTSDKLAIVNQSILTPSSLKYRLYCLEDNGVYAEYSPDSMLLRV